MRKVFRWFGIILGIFLGLFVLGLAALFYLTGERINRVYEVKVEPIAIPTEAASIARGKYLLDTVIFCQECHGQDYSGQLFDEGPLVGRLSMSNLTPGDGGIGEDYSAEDWVRAIRHGIGRDRKSLFVMPSSTLGFLSDEDLGAIIAYLKSIPPVNKKLPQTTLGPLGRLLVLQDPTMLPASIIDHEALGKQSVPKPEASKEYGAYLTNTCKFCHEENLAGGDTPGAGLNLTPGGNLANWTFEDFRHALKTGETPEGHRLDPELMPWKNIGQLNDMEMKAIWLYLTSLPGN
jgi:mono/diheme cytochrome c family protein